MLGLRARTGINPGEMIFINGSDGNVGSAVLRIAETPGARVVVTSARYENASWSRELGADLVINYRSDVIARSVLDFGPGGVNVYWLRRQRRTLPAQWNGLHEERAVCSWLD